MKTFLLALTLTVAAFGAAYGISRVAADCGCNVTKMCECEKSTCQCDGCK